MDIWKSPFLKTKAFSTKAIGLKLHFPIVTVLILIVILVSVIFIAKIENVQNPMASFSHQSGTFTTPFDLNINYPIEGDIRYTTDGTDPSPSSKKYVEKILIRDDTVIKVALFDKDKQLSTVEKRSYISTKHSFPIVSIIINPDFLWDPETGIYTKGNSENSEFFNYDMRGENWRKKAFIEIIDENGVSSLSTDIELRILGGSTRRYEQKSFKLCARETYGSRFITYDFFNDGIRKHKCILLRNSGNDWKSTMFRDSLAQDMVSQISIDTQKSKPSVVYLNGEYWGIYNIREYYDDHYLEQRYGTSRESITIIETDRENKLYPILREGSHGDEEKYLELFNNLDNFEYIENNFDLENYTNYFLINIFYSNDDWLDNNMRIWRLNSQNYPSYDIAPLDGKWRWFLYDLDYVMGLNKESDYDYNTLYKALKESVHNIYDPNKIINSLLKQQEFRHYFINRYADLLNTTFETNRTTEILNNYKEKYRQEISKHVGKWGHNATIENPGVWNHNVKTIEKFLRKRPDSSRQHFMTEFTLSGTSNVYVTPNSKVGGYVKINSINTKDDIKINTLIYFNDIPIKIEAVPFIGYKFAGWSDKSLENKKELTISLTEDITIEPIFVPFWSFKSYD